MVDQYHTLSCLSWQMAVYYPIYRGNVHTLLLPMKYTLKLVAIITLIWSHLLGGSQSLKIFMVAIAYFSKIQPILILYKQKLTNCQSDRYNIKWLVSTWLVCVCVGGGGFEGNPIQYPYTVGNFYTSISYHRLTTLSTGMKFSI